SSVCAVRCEPRRTTPTRCSIWRSYFSETISMQRRRSTGGVISPMILNLNGQHGRVGPSNSAKCKCICPRLESRTPPEKVFFIKHRKNSQHLFHLRGGR